MTLIKYNQILSLSVTSQNGKFVGKVCDLVLDYQTGKILALVLSGQKIIKSERIKNFGQSQILVSDETCENLPSDKIQKARQSKVKIKGNKAVTESGTKLGRIVDFEIDLISNKLSSIFVRTKILGRPLRIPWGQIISIEKDAVIIKDQAVKIAELELVGI